MKKLVSSLLALAMDLSLVACGNTNSSDTGSASSAGNASSSDDESNPIRIGFFAPVSVVVELVDYVTV